ncbi:TRAP transporter small permease subunit [Marinobacterium sedimentorum]|nr:TRAP transporter small permease [Marinobacterium sedimentorum]MCP8687185.1 TRAP transporter small permease [Marinobacterium sedimentorum]
MIKNVLRTYCASVERLVAFIGRSTSYLMPLLALIVAFEVFSRYLLNQPTIWAYDLSLFCFGYLAALGGAYAQQRKAHINVDILYMSVSGKSRRIFNLLSALLAIFFMVIVIIVCIEKFNEAIEFKYRRMSEWAPNMHHFWLMLVISAVLMILQLFSDMIRDAYHLLAGKDLLLNPKEVREDGN